MKNKTKKVLTGLGVSIMGVGSTVAATTTITNCSIDSGYTNLLNFKKPTARIKGSFNSDQSVEIQYFKDVKNNNSIYINDLFWNLANMFNGGPTITESHDLIRFNVKVSGFNINENNELSFNMKFDMEIAMENSGEIFNHQLFQDITFTNIPTNVLFEDNFWVLQSQISNSSEATSNMKWEIKINKFVMNILVNGEFIDENSFTIENALFNFENLSCYDNNGDSHHYSEFIMFLLLDDIIYLSDVVRTWAISL